jgi:hypothetical protein
MSKPSKRPLRAEPELQEAASYVTYEIRMLIYAAHHLGGFHSSPMAAPGDEEKNMALESFLLHFRNLRGFLCPSLQTTIEDDIIASDSLKETTALDHGDLKLLSVDKDRIDKMLAHLSYSRGRFIATGQKGWEVAKMLKLMLGQLQVFLAKLPPTERSWFLPAGEIAEAQP